MTVDYAESKIYGIVNDFMKDKKLRRSDVFQLIKIFDMDGAFIPEKKITQGNTKEFFYSETGISCKDTERVKERNKRKSAVLDYLLGRKEIQGYPYEKYFMSCNLDHALYGVMNLEKDKKQAYADAFYEKFLDRENMFVEFLRTDVVNGAPDSLSASWRYIKEGLHSVERHTNLHVYFIEHPRPDGLL